MAEPSKTTLDSSLLGAELNQLQRRNEQTCLQDSPAAAALKCLICSIKQMLHGRPV